MSHSSPGRPAAQPRLLVLLSALVSLLALVVVPGVAQGAPPARTVAPTGVVATVSTTQEGLGGAVPQVLAQAGVTPVTLTLTLVPEGSTFNQDSTFALDVSLAHGGTPSGTLTPGAVVLPARTTSSSSTFTYSAVDNGVVVTPRMTGRVPKDFTTTVPAAPFQSLKRVTTVAAGPGTTTVGGDVCGADSVDVACATVSLPHGTVSPLAATTVGVCTPDLGCPAGSEVVGFIADLGTAYTRTSPAQITIRCDSTRCGNGSIHDYVVHMSFEASGPLDLVAGPCIAKGVAEDAMGNDFCTDYVASSRDGGDLLLVVNVLHDYRGAV